MTDENVMDAIKGLFTSDTVYYLQSVEVDGDEVVIRAQYEGYEGFYPYEIRGEVFRFSTRVDQPRTSYGERRHMTMMDLMAAPPPPSPYAEGTWMIALRIECEEGPLLEELVDRVTLPEIIQKTGLTRYHRPM